MLHPHSLCGFNQAFNVHAFDALFRWNRYNQKDYGVVHTHTIHAHTDKQQNPYRHWHNPLPPTCRQSRAVLTIRGLFDWHASSKGRKYLSASTTPACFGWGRADDSGDSSLNSHHGCQHQLPHIFKNKYAAYKNPGSSDFENQKNKQSKILHTNKNADRLL